MSTPKTFGENVMALRKSKGLFLRELAKLTDIAQPNISQIEHNSRPCGPILANKLAIGFGLKGQKLEYFLQAAKMTTKRGLCASKLTKREFLDAIFSLTQCSTMYCFEKKDDGLILTMSDKKQYHLSIKSIKRTPINEKV